MCATNTYPLTEPRSRQSAFTLVELLVVVAIIGVLIALLLPAVHRVRESARRTQCSHRMRQVALALQQHHEAHECFPPGVPSCTKETWITGGTGTGAFCQGPNWMCNILTEMGEPVMYQYVYSACETQWNCADDVEHEPGNIGQTTPSFYICPSADKMSPDQRIADWEHDEWISKGNYAANFGSDTYMSFEEPTLAGTFGVIMLRGWEKVTQTHNHATMLGTWKMGHRQGTKIREIKDGTSNTLLISEVLGYDSSKDARGGWVLNVPGSSLFTARTTPNSKINDNISICEEDISQGDLLHCTENRQDGNMWAAARSRHPGGVNAAMADGSLHFLSDDVNLDVWRALSTRAGHEPPPVLP